MTNLSLRRLGAILDLGEQLGLDPKQKAGRLSGGQRAQLALTLAVAKRPELLILDEPVSSLDPLARPFPSHYYVSAFPGPRLLTTLVSCPHCGLTVGIAERVVTATRRRSQSQL